MNKIKNSIETQSFESVWDALSDTPAEAENMKLRSTLMLQIVECLKNKNLNQTEAAAVCQLTRPRMNDLFSGKMSKFSLDALINIAASAGLRINIEIQEFA